MVRGIDFYREYHEKLNSHPNISLEYGQVLQISERDKEVLVSTDQNQYRAARVFNSVFNWKELENRNSFPLLQQHFLGWFVKARSPVFDPEAATFMDFSIPQKGNTRFMYVLPFSDREALVEYTLFSGYPLQIGEYESALEDYLTNTLHCGAYSISATERGRIPMTSYNYAAANTSRVMNIGTAGGWAKASTGFTFMNTHRQTRALIRYLKSGRSLRHFGKRNRFWWYDLLLLDILAHDNTMGNILFEALFQKRKAALILRFLEEKTTFWEDLYVIWACPKKIFIQAFLRRIQKGFKERISKQ
jgi:lycopene beta-cyclase